MSNRSFVQPAHFGLVPGSKPVRAIKPRTGRKTMPGWFPTRKGVDGSIRVETTLERRGLAQFEFNPDVVRMAGQPHELTYWEPRGRLKPRKHTYTPDVALLLRDGSVAVVDFKATRYALDPEWIALEPLLTRAYAEDHGVPFSVRTELEIDIEPRASNCMAMLHSRPIVDDQEAFMAVRVAIAATGLPTTLAAVRALAPLPCDIPEIDRTFSALVELAFLGEVELELGRRFDETTRVSSPRRRPAGGRADAA